MTKVVLNNGVDFATGAVQNGVFFKLNMVSCFTTNL